MEGSHAAFPCGAKRRHLVWANNNKATVALRELPTFFHPPIYNFNCILIHFNTVQKAPCRLTKFDIESSEVPAFLHPSRTMAKSAKEKLAVDGTPKLAAKAKPSDKHEKKNLTIEEATVESPRPSRKRSGDYFDFGDEADRVAEELAADDSKAANAAGASKTSKPNKKAKTDGTAGTKKGKGNKTDAAEKTADDGKTLEDRVVADDKKKQKGKKADSATHDVVVGPSGDTATVPEQVPETVNKAKTGKGKKAETATEDATGIKGGKGKKTDTAKEVAADAKKGKGKKTDAAKKSADDGKTLEERVVADDKKKQKEDAKKQKSKKVDDAEKDVVVGPSGDTATVPEQVPETANKAKKGKAAKDGATSTGKKAAEKPTKRDSVKSTAKDKPESSKDAQADEKKSTKPKETAKAVESKGKPAKSKPANASAAAESKSSTKKAKTTGSKNATTADTTSASAGATMDQAPFEDLLNATDKGKAPVPDDTKLSKAAKAKKDTKKTGKETASEKAPKKAKDDITAKPKKAAKGGESAKPKSGTKANGNKADIPDQAIQPMDLVQEEAAIKELSKNEPSKGKKRKAPSDVAAEMVKSDVLDPLSEHAADASEKKAKKPRKSLGETLGDMVATGADAVRSSFTGILGGGGAGGADGKPTTTGSSHKSKGKGKATDTNDPQQTNNEDDEEDEEEDDTPDDQTVALLAGFESEGDDVHPPGDAGFKEGSKIPSLPKSEATKKLKSIKSTEKDTPGVVYVGRIPHGFYEHEMRTYFTQFGDLSRLRLSRSVKTGHSKHYAFLEFKNADVAKIVVETMDNYLMFGHILKCKLVAPGDVHESMWKGANKRFKKVPWNKIEGRQLEMPVGRDVWKKREEKETTKRAEKSKKTMEKVGYAFEGTGLKSVDTVPKKVIAAATEQEKSLVTAGGEEQAGPVVVSEEVVKVKATKAGKVVAEAASVSVTKVGKRALESGEEAIAAVSKKAKKVKKGTVA